MAQCSERNNSHLKQANAITTRSGKNVDIPMAIQEPKDLKMSSDDIDLSNTDEIVKRAIAIQFLKL